VATKLDREGISTRGMEKKHPFAMGGCCKNEERTSYLINARNVKTGTKPYYTMRRLKGGGVSGKVREPELEAINYAPSKSRYKRQSNAGQKETATER